MGQPAAAEPAKKIRCALLGIDHSHSLDVFKVLKQSPDYEVAGICEPDDAIRQVYAAAPELDGVAWLPVADVLNDAAIEMIAVESGVTRLLEFGQMVISAGKHLHLDKPPGTSLAAFQTLLEDADRNRLMVQMGYMFRYNPGFDFIRKAVAEEWLGRIYLVQASMPTGISAEKRLRNAHHRGGMMLELGCHLIDIIVLLLGTPGKVTPILRHDSEIGDPLSDNCVAVLEYEHAMATVDTSAMEIDAFPTRRFKICGARGKIILEPIEPPSARIWLSEPHGEFPRGMTAVPLENRERHIADFAELARAIRGEIAFPYTSAHDLAVQQTVLRACGESV